MNFPEKFLLHARMFAGDEYEKFIHALSDSAPVSIRHNPYKRSVAFDRAEQIPWSVEGRYLESRPSFTMDPFFHAGCYYVQDASSQFLEKVFIQAGKFISHPVRVLDMCAAPGGKSTHLLSLMSEKDLLICNEVIPSRNNVLRQNIVKWGQSNVLVTQNDPADFRRLGNFFDVIVADAPCSGEGLFRKDPGAMIEWSEENIKRCTIRQQEILDHAYASLKPGGFLIYSTCTFEEEENDMQVESLCRKFEMEVQKIENDIRGISRTKMGLAFFPHRVKGEGFYISLLKKKGELISNPDRQPEKGDAGNNKYLERYLNIPEHFVSVLKDDRLYAVPKHHASDFKFVSRNLFVRLAGIFVAGFKGDDLVPSADVALSCHSKSSESKIALNAEQAIQFLRGGDFNTEAPKGWNLVCFNDFNLGWIKNLGTRMNNYYPKEWRIRS